MAFQTPEVFPASASFPAVASFPSPASFPSAYDPDAVLYFTASGVTDPTQKLNISQFFTGLKANSLWNLLTEGWSGRSSQNAGTGTTLYGFKRAFNGTLVNGPTWGSTGITFSRVPDSYVTTALSCRSPDTIIVCAQADTSSATFTNVLLDNRVGGAGINYSGIQGSAASYLGINNGSGATATGTVTNNIFFIGTTVQSGVVQTALNTGALSGAIAVTNTSGTLRIGSSPSIGGRNYLKPVAGVFEFSSSLSDTQKNLFYSLYKSTIGQGLGLP